MAKITLMLALIHLMGKNIFILNLSYESNFTRPKKKKILLFINVILHINLSEINIFLPSFQINKCSLKKIFIFSLIFIHINYNL